MSQKVQKYRNTNELSKMFGKYYVRAVYDKAFVTTSELADYIQMQASVKRSDCKAVLDELGAAMKHYFELGQKIRLEGIGIFKVGVSSACSDTEAGCTAALVKKSRVNFQPEVASVLKEVVAVQRPKLVNGVPTIVETSMQVYNHPAVMLKDIRFELTKDLQGSGITESGDDSGGGGGDDEPRP